MTAASPRWEPAPSRFVLPRSEAHVWRAGLEPDPVAADRLVEILSADERERADRFTRTPYRQRFILGRGMLRCLLGRYLDRDPARIQFSYGPHGKPALAGAAVGDLVFNVTHSRELALFALVRGRQVGIDLEFLREGVACERIAARFFSGAEVAALAGVPAALRSRAFFNCWTRKEAYLKARGEGILTGLDSFTVSLSPGEPAALLRSDRGAEETARWQLVALGPAPRYVGALCVERDGWSARYFDWPEGGGDPPEAGPGGSHGMAG